MAIETEIRYLEKGKERMGYAKLLETNPPIGSVGVEAAWKILVTERRKRSGGELGRRGRPAHLDPAQTDPERPMG